MLLASKGHKGLRENSEFAKPRLKPAYDKVTQQVL